LEVKVEVNPVGRDAFKVHHASHGCEPTGPARERVSPAGGRRRKEPAVYGGESPVSITVGGNDS
jgi:hypothetical protein